MKQKKRLTPVVPVVLYHGQGRWNAKRLFDYFPKGMDESLKRFTPDMDAVIVDLGEHRDEELERTLFTQASLALSMLLMKNRNKPEVIRDSIGNWLSVMKSLQLEYPSICL